MKCSWFVSFVLMFCGVVASRAEMVDGVVAVVNDQIITQEEVRDFATPAIDSLRRQFTADSPEFREKLNDAITNSLELLIERQLILHYFDTAGYHLPDSAVDELVDERIHNRFGDRITLMKTLQAQGETFEQFREDVRNQYVELELRRRNVTENIVISPYQVETYYKAHLEDYKVEDEVKLRMIVFNKNSPDDTNTVSLAHDVLAKIKAGSPFADMASTYSQGSQKDRGGEMDWTARPALRKELADVAFTLKPGDVSDVIDTPDTCYIMLVEDQHPAHVKPLKEIREDIEKNLRAQKHDLLEKQWIESLKKKTFIRIFA